MSENQTETGQETITAEAAQEENNPKASATFWAMVRGAVETRAKNVPSTVVEHYVSKEIAARVQQTIAAIDALKVLDGQLRKLRPDQEQYDVDGKLVAAYYSKAKLEERKKLVEKTERIEAALEGVFERSNFDKLKALKLEGQGNA